MNGAAEGRRILLVAYFYPPCKDTGAHRPAALAKYLRRAGHQVTVLTTSAYGSEQGAAEVDVVRTADAQLWRARLHGADRIDALYDADTYSPKPHPLSKLLVPEPLIAAWAPFARSKALRLHRARPFDCVITSSPPESAHLVGRALSRRGVAWIADVRDAWTFEPLRPPFPTAPQRALDRTLERRWLGAADVVVCVSEPAAEDLRARGIAEPTVIRNGADLELLEAADPAGAADLLDCERISLVYTGRFGSYGRDPGGLVDGLRLLATEHPGEAARLELVLAGPLTDDEAVLFAGDFGAIRIRAVGALDRGRALALQRAADALLLVAQPLRSQLANFKLYEYFAAGPPVLALAAGTEAGRIVTDAGGTAVRADDPGAVVAALLDLIAGHLQPVDRRARDEHSYPAVAERMSEAVEMAIWKTAADRAPGYSASGDWRE